MLTVIIGTVQSRDNDGGEFYIYISYF